MPSDRLSFAILVGREQDFVALADKLLQLRDVLPLVRIEHVKGPKVMIDVDSEARPARLLELDRYVARATRQVSDVADR